MDTTKALIILAVVGVLGGGAFFLTQKNDSAMTSKQDETSATGQVQKDGAMMEKTDEAMMQKEGEAMMKEEAMMKKDGDVMMKDEGAMTPKQDEASPMGQVEKPEETAMVSKGSYEAYAPEKVARAAEGDVVLFFRAWWCPTCRSLDADIKKNVGAIPSGVTILDVDYDKEKELKQKYGVTYQHTLVQVDASGNLIAKWQGSQNLSAILSKVQ